MIKYDRIKGITRMPLKEFDLIDDAIFGHSDQYRDEHIGAMAETLGLDPKNVEHKLCTVRELTENNPFIISTGLHLPNNAIEIVGDSISDSAMTALLDHVNVYVSNHYGDHLRVDRGIFQNWFVAIHCLADAIEVLNCDIQRITFDEMTRVYKKYMTDGGKLSSVILKALPILFNNRDRNDSPYTKVEKKYAELMASRSGHFAGMLLDSNNPYALYNHIYSWMDREYGKELFGNASEFPAINNHIRSIIAVTMFYTKFEYGY